MIPTGSMIFSRNVLFISILFWVITAKVGGTQNEKSEDALSGFLGWTKKMEMIIHINSDEVLRAIVCRVPFSDISPDALIKATKLPNDRVTKAVYELEVMGLVRLERNMGGNRLIVAATEEARRYMKNWAYNWCAENDKCTANRKAR